MKSNALFNTLFLAFSFAVIIIVGANLQLTNSALSRTSKDSKESEVVYEEEYALNTSFSKAIYQHKI
jgi:hypothetical protein